MTRLKALLQKGWKSKTVFFGFALTIAGAAQTALPDLQTLIPASYFPVITSVVGIIVIALRALTSTSLADK